MDFLKKYKPKHYNNYLHIVDKEIDKLKNKNVHFWLKSLKDKDIFVLNKTVKNIITNNSLYFEESTILMTFLIRLFMLELQIDVDSISLSNKELKKIIKRFFLIINKEMNIRKNFENDNNDVYTLIKDIYVL